MHFVFERQDEEGLMHIQRIIGFHLHIKVKQLFDLKKTEGLQESVRGERLALDTMLHFRPPPFLKDTTIFKIISPFPAGLAFICGAGRFRRGRDIDRFWKGGRVQSRSRARESIYSHSAWYCVTFGESPKCLEGICFVFVDHDASDDGFQSKMFVFVGLY